MNNDNESATGATMPFSDAAWNRTTVAGSEKRAPSTPPSVSVTEPIVQGNISGADLDTFKPGILATVRDGHTGDIIGSRPIRPTDRITITTNTGRQMEVRVSAAVSEGFLY